MSDKKLIDRLEDFFAAGEHTEKIRLFMENESEVIRSTAAYVNEEATETEDGALQYNVNTNSKEGLEAYQLYKRYAEMMEGMLNQFIQTLSADGVTVSLEEIAKDIMAVWDAPEAATNYLCTAYIAAALDFNDFCELALHYECIITHEDDNMEDDDDEEEQEEEA